MLWRYPIAAVRPAHYVLDEFLPDKATDLIHEATSAFQMTATNANADTNLLTSDGVIEPLVAALNPKAPPPTPI